jgi:DNA-binding NtrC family response regulator
MKRRTAKWRLLRGTSPQPHSPAAAPPHPLHRFLGRSPVAQRILHLLPRLATSNVSIVLLGETGVGKSLVARLLHDAGPSASEPFRVINCAAVPETLVESELFGHERGAFSGAVAAREGAFESAGRGTLLLDEIGEMPLASQAKLLRALDERRFERVGSNRSLTLEARVLAATNRDLASMVASGKFRRDLYHRLAVVTLPIPPLRERGEDIALLARELLAEAARSAGREVDGFTPDALDAIRHYAWPGNVRELRNAIEHAVALGEGHRIHATDLPAEVCSGEPHAVDPRTVRLPAPLEWLERRAVDAALAATNGSRTRAAQILGITPAMLYYKLRKAGDDSEGRAPLESPMPPTVRHAG